MSICDEWWKGFGGSKFGECQRCSNKFIEKSYLDKKIKEREIGVGKGVHWKWDVKLGLQVKL
jgi:hypothetical protein